MIPDLETPHSDAHSGPEVEAEEYFPRDFSYVLSYLDNKAEEEELDREQSSAQYRLWKWGRNRYWSLRAKVVDHLIPWILWPCKGYEGFVTAIWRMKAASRVAFTYMVIMLGRVLPGMHFLMNREMLQVTLTIPVAVYEKKFELHFARASTTLNVEKNIQLIEVIKYRAFTKNHEPLPILLDKYADFQLDQYL